MKRTSTEEKLQGLALGSASERSRRSLKDWSGYHSTHNKVSESQLLPGAPLAKAQGWTYKGIKTLMKHKVRFKTPGRPEVGSKAKKKTKHLKPQYSSLTTDCKAASPGKDRTKKEVKCCENIEVEYFVRDCAKGLRQRTVQIWKKFIKEPSWKPC